MNDNQAKAQVPSQTDPPREAPRGRLAHILAPLKSFFVGSWGLTQEYAPKAWEGLKRVLLLRPKSLVMVSTARDERIKFTADANVKDKDAEGKLEIAKAQAREIELKAEAEARYRDAQTELLKVQAERERQAMALQKALLSEAISARIPFKADLNGRDAIVEMHIESPGSKRRRKGEPRVTVTEALDATKSLEPPAKELKGLEMPNDQTPKPEA